MCIQCQLVQAERPGQACADIGTPASGKLGYADGQCACCRNEVDVIGGDNRNIIGSHTARVVDIGVCLDINQIDGSCAGKTDAGTKTTTTIAADIRRHLRSFQRVLPANAGGIFAGQCPGYSKRVKVTGGTCFDIDIAIYINHSTVVSGRQAHIGSVKGLIADKGCRVSVHIVNRNRHPHAKGLTLLNRACNADGGAVVTRDEVEAAPGDLRA